MAVPAPSYSDVMRSVTLTGANVVPLRSFNGKRLGGPVLGRDKGKGELIGQVLGSGQDRVNLNLNLVEAGPSNPPEPVQNLLYALSPETCPRCLTKGHTREACKSLVRCYACLREGHVAMRCRSSWFWREKGRRTNESRREKQVIPSIVQAACQGSGDIGPSGPRSIMIFGTQITVEGTTGHTLPQPEPITASVEKQSWLTIGPNDAQAQQSASARRPSCPRDQQGDLPFIALNSQSTFTRVASAPETNPPVASSQEQRDKTPVASPLSAHWDLPSTISNAQ